MNKHFQSRKRRPFTHLKNVKRIPYKDPSFKRFINVRHPFDRLVSAFYNMKYRESKKLSRGPDMENIDYILNIFNISYEEFKFSHFVNFLISEKKNHPAPIYFDRHWDSFSRLCHVCDQQFSFISRLETIHADSGPILKILEYPENYLENRKKENHVARPLSRNDTNISSNSDFLFGKYLAEFENIPEEKLRKLYERYSADFAAFGYSYDFDSNTAYCLIKTSSGKSCC